MSVESITWALKVPVPTSSAKFVLVVLANQANEETGATYPSIAYLSQATGQNRKTVISNLAKLVEWGLIEDTGGRMGQTKQVVIYRLVRDDLFYEASQNRDSSKNGTVPKSHGNSPKKYPKQSQKRDTEPVEPSGTVSSKDGARDLDFSDWPSMPSPQVLADWLAHRKAKKAPVSQSVVDAHGREIGRALSMGWTVNEALEEVMNRNWQGLKASWLDDKRQAPRQGAPPMKPGKQMQGLMALEGLKRESRLDAGRNRNGAAEALPALAGPHARR